MEQNLKNIVSQFAIEGKVNEILPLGNGLINDTYKVNTVGEETPDYVLPHRCGGDFRRDDTRLP